MKYVGVDLGQKHDHTAIAVVEVPERRLAWMRTPEYGGMLLRYVERVPLGISYPAVVERVREIVWSEEMYGQCALTVDATGVGNPVVDMLRGAGLGCEITAVTITGGDREAQTGGGWSVPKKDLLTRVQVLLEKGELRIAREMNGLGALVKELADVRMQVKQNGRMRFGAEGCGEHDGLTIALALACWRASRVVKTIGFKDRRIPGI